MKLTKLTIRGFRSLKDVTWQPGSLNVVIGPNGSGKSNLIKTLEMISLSARSKLSDQVLREGGMESLVWDGRTAARLSFQIHLLNYGTYHLDLTRLGVSSAYRIEEELLTLDPGERLTLKQTPETATLYEPNGTAQRERKFTIDKHPAESLLSSFAGPFTEQNEITEFQRILAGWNLYQDFQTHRESVVRRAPVSRHETQVAGDGSNLIQVLHTLYTNHRDFRRDLDLAIRAAFGDDFEEIVFPPDADQRIQLRLRWKSLQRAQSAADLSDGTLRFLYLIAILANPNPPALIAIDEPETGLHPAMLPIIAEYAVEASLKTQVIFTTHSAELLNAFEETPTTTVAKWEAGQTRLQTLSGDTLQYWLQEYTLGKLFNSGTLEGLA